MITLNDTFNGHAISRHRTVKTAVKAKFAHIKAVRKANGQNSYLTYDIRDGDGNRVDCDEIERAAHEIESGR